MAYGLSKLHQSTEIVDNNGATQGTIIHTGNVKDYIDGDLVSIKGWSGVLTASGSATTMTVTQDISDKRLLIEYSSSSDATLSKSLVIGTYGTSGNLNFYAQGEGGSMAQTSVFGRRFGIQRASSTTVTINQPYTAYWSMSTGTPSTCQSQSSTTTLYIYDIFVID